MDRDRFIKLWNRGCSMNGCYSSHTKRAWTFNEEITKIYNELIAAKVSILPYFREIYKAVIEEESYGSFPRCGLWDTFHFINEMKIGHPVVPPEARGKAKEVAKIYMDFIDNWYNIKSAKGQSYKRLSWG